MPQEIERPRSVLVLQYLFLLLIVSLGWMTSGFRVSGFAVQATEAIFLVTVLFASYLVLRGVIPINFDRLYLALLLYFATLLLSAIFSQQPSRSMVKLFGEAYLLLLPILAIHCVDSESSLRRVFLAWIYTGGVVGSLGVLTILLFYITPDNPFLGLTLHHYGSLPPGPYPRVQSTFIYPAMLCNYLTGGLLIALASYKLKWLSIKSFHFSFWPMLITAAFTVTPGIGGLILALGLWYFIEFRTSGNPALSRISIAAGSFAAIASLIVSAITLRQIPSSPFYFSLFGLRIDPTQRFLTWQGALETFFTNPITGKGLGLGVAQVFFIAPSGQRQLLTDAHNMFLNIAAEAGIPGLLGILAVCFVMVKRTLPFRIEAEQLDWARIAIGSALISGFIVQGMVGSFENARHLWVLLGLLVALEKIRRNKKESGNILV